MAEADRLAVAVSEVDVATAVQEKLDAISSAHEASFRIGYSEIDFVKTGYRSTMLTFVEGALLTILVIFLFLRDRRATLIAALAIPLSTASAAPCIA